MVMYFFPNAVSLIKKYEPYYDTAHSSSDSENDFWIGYGLNYYPDNSPVKKGQKITKKKADEYLKLQLQEISEWIDDYRLSINENQKEALVSFIHSVGLDIFEESLMFGLIEKNKLLNAAEEFSRWIYDENGYASPLLIERRRHEKLLFLSDLVKWDDFHSPLLLECFKTYCGSMQQDMAINFLEQKLDPYLIAEFFNIFKQDLQQPTG
jgi:GH24 family phage-related lysozyme (muramidase)